ncbi:HD domain-containing protein [Aquamicrobium sp.]|uniref:HD domain-containing protein n=1 Tax=Aquamicrobium sp. TaxID=1872579 RepID=UPI00258931F2|nr:HD domain-containing protein [Aquamicrobium sp.]MCK9550941.1 HD domain-containing protein [Aquamicrobium sp.]
MTKIFKKDLFWMHCSCNDVLEKVINEKRREACQNKIKSGKQINIKLMFEEISSYGEDFNFFLQKGINGFLLAQIFNDFVQADFIDTSAVSGVNLGKKKEIKNDFDKAGNIDLYTHTINVAKKAFDIKDNITMDDRRKLAIIALLHDAGKSAELIKMYNIPLIEKNNEYNKAHEAYSVAYAYKVLANVDKILYKSFERILKKNNSNIQLSDEENKLMNFLYFIDSGDRRE